MTAARLSHLQTQIREFLYRGHHEHDLAAQVRVGGTASASERLDVYRHAYFIRLEQALAHDFPVTERLLGQTAFARCAGDYVLAFPSRSPSLRELGYKFSAWLRTEKTPALADLAAIEWAVLRVFDGPDSPTVNRNRLQAFASSAWSRLEIRLIPTLTLLSLTSNADRVWLKKGQDIELESEAKRFISIWRGKQNRPMLVGVDANTYAVLQVLGNEPGLSVASELLAEMESDPAAVPLRIAETLHHALAQGWIATIDTPA